MPIPKRKVKPQRRATTDRQRVRKFEAKHEIFAQEIAAGSTHVDAYIKAGMGVANARTAGPIVWMKWSKMRDRIEELLSARRIALDINADKLILKFWTVHDRALGAEDFTGACKALENIGKLLDLYPSDKSQVDIHLIVKPAREPTKQIELSVEEWQEQWSPKEITNGHGH